MTAPPDDLEEKVDILLENIAAKEREQHLQKENQELRKQLEQLKQWVRGNGPIDDYKDLQEKFRDFEKLGEANVNAYSFDSEKYYRTTHIIADTLLTPKEIDDFFNVSGRFQGSLGYQNKIGSFMSRLIQNSYSGGNNDFILTTKGYPPSHGLGVYLLGQEENPLRITIKGDIGDRCFLEAKFVDIKVKGTVGQQFASGAFSSKFCVDRLYTGYTCGHSAIKCTFEVKETNIDTEEFMKYAGAETRYYIQRIIHKNK